MNKKKNQPNTIAESSESSLNLAEIRELAEFVDAHGYTEFEYENENIRIRLTTKKNTHVKEKLKGKSKDEPFVINGFIRIEDEEFYSLDYFRDLYPSAEITSIDGKDVLGKCVSCECCLLDGDETFDWTDEIACAECEEKRLKGEW